MSLQQYATQQATHVLYGVEEGGHLPVCFLLSELLDLNPWSNRDVTVTGRLYQVEGWQYPLLKVENIMRLDNVQAAGK